MTHGELFAGISGFSLGFGRAGIQTAWHVEIDPVCRRVLRRHYPDTLLLSDVRECGAHNLPWVDVITFGSPCQGLSQAGLGKGLLDERSKLFFEAVRILAELKPTFAVWENVPRALTLHRGRDFSAILRAFRQCGARDIAWRTLDSRYCGVAQRRERVFLVADFRSDRAAEILFESESRGWHPAPSRETGARVAATITSGVGVTGNAPGRRREDDVNLVVNAYTSSRGGPDDNDAQAGHLVCAPLRENHYGDHVAAESQLVITSDVAFQCHGSNVGEMGVIRKGNGGVTGGVPFIVHTITSGHDASEDGTGRGIPLVFDPTQVTSRHNRSNPRAGDPCHSIAASAAAPCVAQTVTSTYDGMMVRRLTPTEVEALFAYPRDYTAFDADGKTISDSARYRMLGNSVVTTVTEWIGKRIVAAIAAEVAA